MKKMTLIVLLLSFLNISALAQRRNEIVVNYGFADNDISMDEDIIGDMGFAGKKTAIFELNYLRKLSSTISLETGVAYSRSKLIYHYFPSGVLNTEEQEIKLLSVPFGINFSFLKYLFVSAGAIIDIESGRTSTQATDNQSGVGLYGGVGAKYSIGKFSIRINPFILEHSLIPFEKEAYGQRLWERGVKIGAGYSF